LPEVPPSDRTPSGFGYLPRCRGRCCHLPRVWSFAGHFPARNASGIAGFSGFPRAWPVRRYRLSFPSCCLPWFSRFSSKGSGSRHRRHSTFLPFLRLQRLPPHGACRGLPCGRFTNNRPNLGASFRALSLRAILCPVSGYFTLDGPGPLLPFRPPEDFTTASATRSFDLHASLRFARLPSLRILTWLRPGASLACGVGVFLSPERRPLQDFSPCARSLICAGALFLDYGAFALCPRNSVDGFTFSLVPLRKFLPASPGFPGPVPEPSATRASLIFTQGTNHRSGGLEPALASHRQRRGSTGI
jgi:hypothetical protein